MHDLRAILTAFDALRPGDVAVLGSVVRAEGSTYRRPGARMLVRPDDTIVGLVGGGCLEGDLLAHAVEVRISGQPRLVRYDTTREEDLVWGLGLGCAGIVEVLLEPVSADRPGPLGWLRTWADARATGVFATVLDGERLAERWALHPEGRIEGPDAPEALLTALHEARADARSRRIATPIGDVAIEVARPPLRLVVFGAGPDAVPVVRIATELGWNVEVADPRPAYALPERFPGARVHHLPAMRAVAGVGVEADTHALVMTHHYLHDRAILGNLLASPARYIGVLGPRKRTEDLLADLAAQGVALDEESVARVHGPAGLDLGAEGPEAIAVSLVSEVLAVSEGRRGGWLRERKGPIYEPETA